MSHSFASLFLMGQPAGGGSSTVMLIWFGLIFVVFYFFMIRPQASKAKKQKSFLSGLQKGDKIVTIAGIHGTVYKINDDNTTLQLEVSPGSYLKIEKSAISMEWTSALQKALGAPAEAGK
jgi:preprotein translocase subunit YajC